MKKAKATLSPVQGEDSSRRFYQIYFGEQPSDVAKDWIGPFANDMIAKKRAEYEAKRNNLELEWVE